MTAQSSVKLHKKIALALGLIAGGLALSAALIRYVRFGEIDVAKIAAGIFFPLVIYSLMRRKTDDQQ